MLISLARLIPEGIRFEHQYKDDEIDLSHHDFLFRRPPLVAGRITRAGVDLKVSGQMQAVLELPCDRCLAPVIIETDQPFELFYSPGEYEAGKVGETELHGRDLDFSVYESDEFELDELVLEQLELNLPSRVLCREECRGLCPQCGTDLNYEQCQCQEPVDPRWQALAELKRQSDE